jgi:hypothetical protein
MAVIHDRTVILAGQNHILDVFLFPLGQAKGTDYPGGLIEVVLVDKFFNHFMLPSALRLNDLLAAAGFARRLLLTVVPPFPRGVM